MVQNTEKYIIFCVVSKYKTLLKILLKNFIKKCEKIVQINAKIVKVNKKNCINKNYKKVCTKC